MREILFRGKCVDTGIWYEGYYIHLHKTTYCFTSDYDKHPDNDIHQIVIERMTDWGLPNQHYRVDVDPKTVGQFTGLADKNGKKIFEGDIVRYMNKETMVVVWNKDSASFVIAYSAINFNYLATISNGHIYLEVIGNIHDNPELLGGAADG